MPITVMIYGIPYICAHAVRGIDFVHLYDEGDHLIASFRGISDFDGYSITGGEWSVPEPDPLAVLVAENTLLKAQVQALTDRGEFVEDCIAELAMQVYA